MSEKLGKWYGCALGGLGKKMGDLAGMDGDPVVFVGKEAVRREEA